MLDTDWIPQVAAQGWLIITRDSMISQNRNEITAGPGEQRQDGRPQPARRADQMGQLEVFMTQWRRIEALTAQPGPFIWRTSRTAMTPIALD